MENKKLKIAIILNIIIVIFTIAACTIMFTGFKFMDGDIVLESTKIGMFRFFTVDSNIFMGIVALTFAVLEIKLLKGKIEGIKTKQYILKLMSTVGVALTFFVVITYLGPISTGGIPSMFKNSNLFFHLLIPLLSIFNFICFENTNKLKFKHTFLGIIPVIIYGAYYLTNTLIHVENGKVPIIYDWYWFMQGGLWQILIAVPIIFGITYIISLILWKVNKISIK